jgi:feruloyl esterase
MRNDNTRVRFAALLLTATAVAIVPGTSSAGRQDDHHAHSLPPGTAACAALAGARAPSTTIVSTAMVAATATTPEYCRVLGFVDTEINFELRLPTAWNKKFLYGGEGGLAGQISDQTGLQAGGRNGTQRGYATVFSDTGHQGKVLPGATSPVYDGSWALDNPERQVNWAHRSVHVVGAAAKDLIAGYYGRAPRYSYFSGCSGGGRQAVMTAQRYPEDFDGIIAGAPWLNVTGQVMLWNWIVQALAETPIAPAKLSLIANNARAACDARDGLQDGLIGDPERCEVSVAGLACRNGGDGADCLNAGEMATLSKIYAGPHTSSGKQLFPPYTPGSENVQWPRAIVNDVNGGPGQLLVFLPDQFLRFFVFGPDFDTLRFDFDRDPSALREPGKLFNVTTDLAAFRRQGGKLLMYHGWTDPRLAPIYSVNYRNMVVHRLGGDPRKTDAFFRLFMAPGMGHCLGGEGPNSFDALTALEDWVERGVAPERIVASHANASGVVDRTRPLCAYPKVAKYKGSGSIDDAQNFTCATPAHRGHGDHRH